MSEYFLKSINFRNGKITYNSFDINPLIPLSRQKFSLQQDMLQVRYGLYLVDVGWYSSLNVKGRFVIYLIHNCDWDEPVRKIEAKNTAALKVGLQKMIDYCEALTSNNILMDIDIKYSPAQFGEELKIKLQQQESVEKIGQWAYSAYLDHIEDVDSDFEDLLLTLNKMELGPGFTFSYEQLNQIADDLIAGKNVKL